MKQRSLSAGLLGSLMLFVSGVFLAAPVQGQEQEDQDTSEQVIERDVDPSTLENGQRIRVLMTHGSQLKGKVNALTERGIKLDMSKEEASLSGVVTIPLDDVSSISTLKPLRDVDQNQKKKKTTSKKKDVSSNKKKNSSDQEKNGKRENKQEASEKDDGQASADKNEGADKGKGNQEQDPDKLTSEQRQMLEQFPQEKWSEKRYSKLSRKREFQLTAKEKAFVGNWDKLKKAREVQQRNKQEELLQEFHPDDGWTPEKYKYLKNELGGLGATGVPQRNEKQNRFVEVYSQWEKAYERYKKKQEKKKEGEQNEENQKNGAR